MISEMHDNKYMQRALELAKESAECGEIPVGCVIVKDDIIIAESHNTVEKQHCPTCHAEINAINIASQTVGKFLTDCDMYVTLEPCPMCTGAIINSRIRRLYIGAPDAKTGCCGSKLDIITKQHFNHKVEVYYGIMESKCSQIISDFFKILRNDTE